MRSALVLAFVASCTYCSASEPGVEALLAEADPAMQQQLSDAYEEFARHNFEATAPIEPIAAADQSKLVKQLAIFAATAGGDEERPLGAVAILARLQVPPTLTLRVLAPYLETSHPQLRAFVHDCFPSLDDNDGCDSARKPYVQYVRLLVSQDEDIPPPFVRFIYARSPGQALLVFRFATIDNSAYMQALRNSVIAAEQGREPTPQEREDARRAQEAKTRAGIARRELLLAEHIVSSAIWLKEHKFNEQFQEALPSAAEQLRTLADSDEWWVRLYVASIMQQHAELRSVDVVERLRDDDNDAVSELSQSIAG